MSLECKVMPNTVYFEGAWYAQFRKLYRGVIVNAETYNGEGYFAIRKPLPKKYFWRRRPPRGYIIWKTSREVMNGLRFCDSKRSIEIDADFLKENKSERVLTFDEQVYKELKEVIPGFLLEVGYKYNSTDDGDVLELRFERVI